MMKMTDEMKTEDKKSPATNEGTYSLEDMEGMLEQYMNVKAMEQDSQCMAMLKNYARSKVKSIDELFGANADPKTAKPKTLQDMKKKYNDMMMSEDDSSEGDSEE